VLDHNRMLVDAEIQRADGSWRAARLWVDTGNPELFLSEELAHDLGIRLSAGQDAMDAGTGQVEVAAPTGFRLGGMPLHVDGVTAKVMLAPRWLFATMNIDANVPATVLQRYQVVFDYPRSELTVAEPGTVEPRGERCSAAVHPATGIVQIDVEIDGESMSFALDNGASYSFKHLGVVARGSDLADRARARDPLLRLGSIVKRRRRRVAQVLPERGGGGGVVLAEERAPGRRVSGAERFQSVSGRDRLLQRGRVFRARH
jgi:hypothetical protein